MPNISGTMFLNIVKGIAKTPQDSTSAEQGLDEINLLDPNGFSCEDYQIKIPSMKSSAVYADSPITDGRTLISGALGNVTETIRLTLNASTMVQLAAMLSKLGRFKQDCNDFWDTFGQIEPVYIKHQVDGEPGPRYALLYDIDIDIESPIDPSTPMRTVTLSIEREFGWRGVAPGDNPKRWTYYVQKRPYTSASAALTSGGDHLATATIQNRREWNAGQTALGTQNYFDIPAASIPGDLDALCLLATTLTSGTSSQLYIARESKPDLSPGGTTRKPAYTLNAGDATLTGSDTTTGADTGAPISTNAAVNTRGAVSFATVATDTNRFTWHGGARGLFDMSSLRGRFMAFVRARLSASSTVTMHLSYGSSFATLVTPTATFTDATALGTGNTTEWSWVYLGLLTLPYSGERVQIKDDGLGINVNTGTTPYITLFAARTGGATNLYVSDVVFIPIDEAALLIDCGNTNSNTNYMIDNTGYLLHGQTDSAVHVGTIGSSESVEVRGQSLTLKPGVLNRILFMATNQTSSKSSINKDFAVRLNIVPRWSGYRDA